MTTRIKHSLGADSLTDRRLIVSPARLGVNLVVEDHAVDDRVRTMGGVTVDPAELRAALDKEVPLADPWDDRVRVEVDITSVTVTPGESGRLRTFATTKVEEARTREGAVIARTLGAHWLAVERAITESLDAEDAEISARRERAKTLRRDAVEAQLREVGITFGTQVGRESTLDAIIAAGGITVPE